MVLPVPVLAWATLRCGWSVSTATRRMGKGDCRARVWDSHVFSLQGRVNAHGLDIGHRFVAHVVDNRPEDVGVHAERGEIGESGDKTGLVAAILGLGGGGGTRVIPRDDLTAD